MKSLTIPVVNCFHHNFKGNMIMIAMLTIKQQGKEGREVGKEGEAQEEGGEGGGKGKWDGGAFPIR